MQNNTNSNMIVAPSTLPSPGVFGLVNNKPAQTQTQTHPLKCPRCNSANTKFCYYNNYSLSQPRHFCKACKRYWTRGGTLRNVPVGGGCRKNKRSVKRPTPTTSTTSNAVKLPSSSTTSTTTTTASPTIPNPQMMSHHHHHPFPPSCHVDNPLLYGELGFLGVGNLGLGFPNMMSKPFLSSIAPTTFHHHHQIQRNSSDNHDHDQMMMMMVGQNHLQTTNIASSLQDYMHNNINGGDHQISGYVGLSSSSSSDPSNYNNTNAVGSSWLDPITNLGSSLTSLI